MHKKHLKKPEPLIVTGIIRIHPRGFGFLIPDNRELFPEDIFIPRHATEGAVDGDTVEATAGPSIHATKGPEGRILKILRRGRSHLAGVITYVGGKGQIFAYAPLLGESVSLRIMPSDERELEMGDRITIHVLDWGSKRKGPLGEMSAYIGHISDPLCDIPAAIEEFDLAPAFSLETLEEARAFGQSVSPQDCKNREDLRDAVCFTIDPETAKDFDDALSLTQDSSGNFHLGVHIADVSHYVKPGTSLDDEALTRCNSVYFPGTVVPMLPHELSSHLCSLKPDVNRLAVSVLVTLDPEGHVTQYKIVRSVIRSQKRFSYQEAKEVLDGRRKSKFKPELELMVHLCHLLKKKRYARGSIEFSLPDLTFELDETGNVKGISLIEYDITHQLVEEFMLLANETVASHLSSHGKPLTYRIHEEPNPENLRDFSLTASALGFEISSEPTTEELQVLFDSAKGSPFGEFLATAFIKSMKLAAYSTQNIGHYGLGLAHYTHFTSPIRRYIDLVVHRTLFGEVGEEEDLNAVAARCSEQERLSAKAESSVLQLKKIRYLEAKALGGQDTFDAIIISIKPFGILFELKEILYEGFLPLQRENFAVGAKIQVKLSSVDLVTRQLVWNLISSSQPMKTGNKVGRKGNERRRVKGRSRRKK